MPVVKFTRCQVQQEVHWLANKETETEIENEIFLSLFQKLKW